LDISDTYDKLRAKTKINLDKHDDGNNDTSIISDISDILTPDFENNGKINSKLTELKEKTPF